MFTWNVWDFDFEGDAFIIAKRECLKEDVPDYIIKADNLPKSCKDGMVVEEGICRYQVKYQWENYDEPCGGYYVVKGSFDTKGKRGWFPVWIVRVGEWY